MYCAGGSQPTLSAALATCGVKPVARRRSVPRESARLNDFLKSSALGAVAPEAGFQQTDGLSPRDTALTRLGSAPVQETGA